MKECVFLSIDFDYWQGLPSNAKFVNRCLEANRGMVSIVPSHEMLLPFVEASHARTIINIDYHADLADIEYADDTRHLEDGTWANFVSWRYMGHFSWYMPNQDCYRYYGRCDNYHNPFVKKTRKHSGWERTSIRIGLPDIKKFDVVGIGFAISPLYVAKNVVYANAKPLIRRRFISRNYIDEIFQVAFA